MIWLGFILIIDGVLSLYHFRQQRWYCQAVRLL